MCKQNFNASLTIYYLNTVAMRFLFMLLFQILVKIKINEQDFSFKSNYDAFQAIKGNDKSLNYWSFIDGN